MLLLASLLAVAVSAAAQSGDAELSTSEALLLGAIEGVTEYLPVSSTAHLAITEDLLGLTRTPEGRKAADSYAIVIQIGAIAAVLGLYRGRLVSLGRGVFGHDPQGRQLAVAIVVAFAPAATAGLVVGDAIKTELFSTWPIVAAWAVGGLALLWPRLTATSSTRPLEELTIGAAAMIGAAQVLALWPGTSRSLVTIIAALAVGMSLAAAVEFSFLLGLITLSAATGYELLNDGDAIIDTFGWGNSLVGILAAAVTAWAAVRWMVAYLQRRPLSIFGFYRIAIAAAVALLAAMTGLL
ncbi:MAG: undecaprenyl-diphosphate phosphatase [Acidimicrobiales bacterium]|nr:undecaprenyl-diphosphate phosphatase [Acidimicrobiales bacterium]